MSISIHSSALKHNYVLLIILLILLYILPLHLKLACDVAAFPFFLLSLKPHLGVTGATSWQQSRIWHCLVWESHLSTRCSCWSWKTHVPLLLLWKYQVRCRTSTAVVHGEGKGGEASGINAGSSGRALQITYSSMPNDGKFWGQSHGRHWLFTGTELCTF